MRPLSSAQEAGLEGVVWVPHPLCSFHGPGGGAGIAADPAGLHGGALVSQRAPGGGSAVAKVCGAHEAHVPATGKARGAAGVDQGGLRERNGRTTTKCLRETNLYRKHPGACARAHTAADVAAPCVHWTEATLWGPPRTLWCAHGEVALAHTRCLMKGPGSLYALSTSLPVLSLASHRRPGEMESSRLRGHPTRFSKCLFEGLAMHPWILLGQHCLSGTNSCRFSTICFLPMNTCLL